MLRFVAFWGFFGHFSILFRVKGVKVPFKVWNSKKNSFFLSLQKLYVQNFRSVALKLWPGVSGHTYIRTYTEIPYKDLGMGNAEDSYDKQLEKTLNFDVSPQCIIDGS